MGQHSRTLRDTGVRRRRAIDPQNRDFLKLTAAWAARTDLAAVDTGLPPEEALRCAPEFLRLLQEGQISAAETDLDDAGIDVLHAACRLLLELEPADAKDPIKDARNLYEFIEKAGWPEPDFDERAEILADCAFAAWRVARKKGSPLETETWRKRFLSLSELTPTIQSTVESVLLKLDNGSQNATEFLIGDPEILLSVFGALRKKADKAPASVRGDAVRLYELLSQARLEECFSEERDQLLFEFALLAGMTSRRMFRRQDAWSWFGRAKLRLTLLADSSAEAARLEYQRLALRAEERHFEEVLKLCRQLRDTFRKLQLAEDALKCLFLEAVSLAETGRDHEAIEVLKIACDEAKNMGNVELLSMALNNLTLYHRTVGNLKKALMYGRTALPLLQELDDRVNLAKFRWTVGDILREQGKLGEAAAVYREALTETETVGTRADSVLIHLALAGVLLDLGLNEESEREIRAALPIIEEEKMVPEGYAALALLQESLRRRKIDRQALRNLHGFFQDEKS